MMDATARVVVCLCLGWAVCQVRGSYIPVEMNRTIQNLLQHYKIPPKERFNGKPVVPREPLSGKMESKMLYMGGMLEMYEQLIGKMLKQLPTPSPKTAVSAGRGAAAASDAAAASGAAMGAGGDVRKQLSYILKKVHDLRTRHYHEQDQFLQRLKALRQIPTDNFVTQSKALWELIWLYQEASSLPDNEMQKRRRRRRRQAQRAKTQPRA